MRSVVVVHYESQEGEKMVYKLILDKLKKYLIIGMVFALTLQTTLITVFKPQIVKACVTASNIIINEFLPYPNSGNDWVELYNPTDSPIDLTGWHLDDSGSLMTALSGTIDTGGYAVFYVGSRLDNTLDDAVKLYNNSETLIDSKSYTAISVTQGLSIGRLPNASDVWAYSLTPTPLANNDSTLPTSSITYPLDSSDYNGVSSITGTASDTDSGINKVEVKIHGDTEAAYFSGSGWATSEYWFPATGTTNWYYVLNTSYFTNGRTYTIYSKATDNSGNIQESYSSVSFTFDNLAPTNGSIKINNGEGVTNNRAVTLALNAAGATQMKIWGNGDYTALTNDYIDYATSKPWTLSSENGLKTIYVKYKDSAGNESATYQNSIYYNLNSDTPQETQLTSPTTYPYSGEFSATNASEVKVEATISGETFMTVSHYNQNPTSTLPSGVTTLGKYYDFSMPDASKVTLPVKIKIYYTLTDLANAQITDENKLQGIYYWDFNSSSWKLFSSTGVNTADTGIYAGYIWADVNDFSLITLTPLSGGADTTAPSKPANFKTAEGNGEISLNWDKKDDAVGYYIRYRKTTTNDNDPYTTIYLSGGNTTSTKITGLTNDTEYEFGVAAKDASGNISVYAVVVGTPKSSSGTATQTSTQTSVWEKEYWVGTAVAADSTESETQNQQVTTDESANDEGEVKSDESENQGANWTRFLVTLGIIILAAGAGLGGYYGYQWWMGEDEKNEKEEKPAKKDKKEKRDNRW